MKREPSAEEYAVSRRVLERSLFHLGHVPSIPASDAEIRTGLIKALRHVVGGSDGILAALSLLEQPHAST
jgi:hypothetical protein